MNTHLKVSHSSRKPILRFDRAKNPSIPTGDVLVLVGERAVSLSFQKIAVNVARATDGGPNILPLLMRAMLGEDAGLPGTSHVVVLEQATWARGAHRGEWVLRPLAHGERAGTVLLAAAGAR